MIIMSDITSTIKLAERLRLHSVQMTHAGKSSHVGSVLSICDILAVLYGDIMNIDPHQPRMQTRDRFILSKGHAGAGVYAVLAELGFFDKEILASHYQNGSNLSGHVSHHRIPGVELSTGSLGHGLSVGAGYALSAKLKLEQFRTYILLSDGECDEGSNWEAILFAGHHKLDNLCATVDYNKLQSLDTTDNTLSLEPFTDKWIAFGWEAIVVNGHDHLELLDAYRQAAKTTDKPCVIIANTTKGKGISFMENKVLWHYRSPQGEEFKAALSELKSAKS